MERRHARNLEQKIGQEKKRRHKNTDKRIRQKRLTSSFSKYTCTIDWIVSPICTSSKNCTSGATFAVSECSDGLYDFMRCVALRVLLLDYNSHKTKEDKNALIKSPNDMSLPQHKQKRNKHLLDRIPHAGAVVSWIPRKGLDAFKGGAGEVDEVEG